MDKMAITKFAQERAEKNVSVDCGKGNAYHKVHGFVDCFISHSDDFQGIDHINIVSTAKIARELKA